MPKRKEEVEGRKIYEVYVAEIVKTRRELPSFPCERFLLSLWDFFHHAKNDDDDQQEREEGGMTKIQTFVAFEIFLSTKSEKNKMGEKFKTSG